MYYIYGSEGEFVSQQKDRFYLFHFSFDDSMEMHLPANVNLSASKGQLASSFPLLQLMIPLHLFSLAMQESELAVPQLN